MKHMKTPPDFTSLFFDTLGGPPEKITYKEGEVAEPWLNYCWLDRAWRDPDARGFEFLIVGSDWTCEINLDQNDWTVEMADQEAPHLWSRHIEHRQRLLGGAIHHWFLDADSRVAGARGWDLVRAVKSKWTCDAKSKTSNSPAVYAPSSRRRRRPVNSPAASSAKVPGAGTSTTETSSSAGPPALPT